MWDFPSHEKQIPIPWEKHTFKIIFTVKFCVMSRVRYSLSYRVKSKIRLRVRFRVNSALACEWQLGKGFELSFGSGLGLCRTGDFDIWAIFCVM